MWHLPCHTVDADLKDIKRRPLKAACSPPSVSEGEITSSIPPAVTHAESVFREVFSQVKLMFQSFLIELGLKLRQLLLQTGDLGLVWISRCGCARLQRMGKKAERGARAAIRG